MEHVLRIHNLTVGFETEDGLLTAAEDVSLKLKKGEILALVGESGCGKTVLCKSIMGLLCEKGRIGQGEIFLQNENLLRLSGHQLERCRGRKVAMIFQDPMTSLDPTMTVGAQIAEVLTLHGGMDKKQAKKQAIALMELVDIDQAESRFSQMPWQFSGGMRQRIAIAIALAGNPDVILADEPTTALDEATRNRILTLLSKIKRETGVAMVFITHDLGLVEDVADRVAIMQGGHIVESGQVGEIFQQPAHPYTKQLLGYVDYQKNKGHHHKHRQAAKPEPLIEIRGLEKTYPIGKRRAHQVFENLTLDIYRGEILGLTGASGCGKSTLARCIMGIEKSTGGTISFYNRGAQWKQLIFQDSDSAFNPKMTIEKIIGEPLRVRQGKAPERHQIAEFMEQAELSPTLMDRYPYEISGGQRQRAAIARAISTDPEFIIADEPLSSLDVSTQAQIIHLFRTLQEKKNLTILLIAHDLPMVNHVSDRVLTL